MKHLLRALPWIIAITILLLSVVPPEYRPVTAPRSLEHLAIFTLFGLAVGFAYPNHHGRRVATLIVITGLLELVQMLMPGRHARLSDFVVDLVGGLLGLWVTWLLPGPAAPVDQMRPTPAASRTRLRPPEPVVRISRARP